MANEQNLIPNSQRTPQELREITRKGGIASGRARRAKRTAYEIAKMFFEEKIDVPGGHKIDRKQLMLMNAFKRINNSLMSNSKNALTNEELKCLDYALQMIGEAPIPKTQQEITVSAPIQIIDDVDTDDDKSEGTD